MENEETIQPKETVVETPVVDNTAELKKLIAELEQKQAVYEAKLNTLLAIRKQETNTKEDEEDGKLIY